MHWKSIFRAPASRSVVLTRPRGVKSDRCGAGISTSAMKCGFDKIAAIVVTDLPDKTRPFSPPDDVSRKISENIIAFFEQEVAAGRLTNSLLPLQSGVGNVANAVLSGLQNSRF